uniref:Probable cell division protein WhiA n=2 Tax=Fervidobacterium nodosum TaxID=2424 RepID=A0A7C5Y7C9_9BACT
MRYTFSEEVKGELCQVEVLSSDEAQAELAGYLKGKGILVKSSTDVYISLEVGFIPAARRIMNLMHLLGVDKKRLTLLKNRLQKKRVQIFIPTSILEKIDISILETPNMISEDIGFFGAFLRGLFVSTGSITDPSKHYHLEFVSYNEMLLRYVDELLNESLGISGKISKMNYNYRYYIKRGRDIQEILELMGATRGASHFEKILTSREIKSDINRSLNFLTANAKRTGESNAKQIECINIIKEKMGFDNLPEDLREIAQLRLENEDLSLTEIGELLNPPLTKSMVYNRIRKLMNIAKELENEYEDSNKSASENLIIENDENIEQD